MAKARPQTTPAKRPPTPDPKDVICPHKHFKYDIIDRDMLSRKQHLNLLCTPKGYRWVMMKGDAPDEMRDQDDLPVHTCKVVKKKPGKTYVHNILAELWSLLTPEMVARLKEMLMAEFGLTEEAAEDFICHSRYDTLQTAQKSKRKKDTDEHELEEDNDQPPRDPTLPRLIVDPKLCDKSQFAIGIDPCHIREFSRVVSTKFAEYVSAMMCARRNNRHRRMAEVVLNGLCNLTGEKTTLDNPKNRLHKILTLTSDRVAIWLAENMEDDDIKRAKRRRKEDDALRKRKLEKHKERERRRKEKERMNKEIERNKKRKAREDAEIEKQKQEEQERKEAEKEKRRKEIEKFREEDKKKKQEEEKRAKEEEEKKKQEKKDKHEKRKQRPDGTRPASAAPAKKERQKQTGAGKKPATTGRDQSPSKKERSTVKSEQGSTGGDETKSKPPQDKSQPVDEEKTDKEPETEPEAGEEETDTKTATTDTGEGQGAKEEAEPETADQTDERGESDKPPAASDEPASAEVPEEKPQPGDARADQTGDAATPAAGTEDQPETERQPGANTEVDATAGTDQAGVQPAASKAEADTVPPKDTTEAGEKPAEGKGEEGAPATTGDQLTDKERSQREMIEKVLSITASQISATKPQPTPRQEALQDILSKELEKAVGVEPTDKETSDVIKAVSSKIATWIDQNVKDAEIEYGTRSREVEIEHGGQDQQWDVPPMSHEAAGSHIPPTSGVSSVSRVPPVSGVSSVSRVPPVSGVSSVSRVPPVSGVSSMSRVPPVSGVSSVSRLPPVPGVSSVSRIPLLSQKAPVSQRGKGPSFVIKKTDHRGQTYDVRLANHTEVGQRIRAARLLGRETPSIAHSDPIVRAKWAVNASQMADEWGHWIDKTIQDAEDKAVQYQTKAKEGKNNQEDDDDWKRFVESTTEDALTWRRKKKAIDEAAKDWRLGTR